MDVGVTEGAGTQSSLTATQSWVSCPNTDLLPANTAAALGTANCCVEDSVCDTESL